MNINSTNDLIVTIQCLAYNHEPYIRQCLEGFVMQKTDFRFEAIVHDDASTDGTAAIIKEYAEKYPEIIKPIFETENQYSKRDGSLNRIMNEHTHGKYVAICEGDDYWIDPMKLQKQVDFLESNPEYIMVYTGFINVNHKGIPISRKYHDSLMNKSKSGWIFHNLLWENFIMTLSVCFRRDIYEDEFYKQMPLSYDYVLFLCSSLKGKIKYLPDITGAYRKVSTGAVTTLGSKLYYMADLARLYVIDFFFKNKRDYPFFYRIKTYWAIDKLVLRLRNTHKLEFRKLLINYPILFFFLIPVFVSKLFALFKK